MKSKKKKAGAPLGNQNAKKQPGEQKRKQYVNVFGQRWDLDTGRKILAYLERTEQSQKQYLKQQVERDILSEENE